jgi:hypothetical protein
MHEHDQGCFSPWAETKEIPERGELYFLWHPGTEDVSSGYGLVAKEGFKDHLVGILMVDRPRPVDPEWLKEVEATFGEYHLVAMTAAGERGIGCQMQIEPDSLPHLRQYPGEKATAIRTALEPLLANPPKPVFILHWDEEVRLWRSQFPPPDELPAEIREVFERFGYGCLAAETNIGVVHVCHAADSDIEGFANKPVLYQWQLVKMPTAPLIRLELAILDHPSNPYRLESFLNVAQEDQARILAQLANQDPLYLAFHGDDLNYRFTKIVDHDRQQWQYLDELVEEATDYWDAIPPEQRDFDQAKAEFMRRFM